MFRSCPCNDNDDANDDEDDYFFPRFKATVIIKITTTHIKGATYGE
jgi:hypothetical protein